MVGDDEAGTLDLKLPAPDEPASGGELEEESERESSPEQLPGPTVIEQTSRGERAFDLYSRS